jgi:chromosome partitioning protein
MRKIAVLNQKGGVGKTTTVVNTAAALANSGAKVAIFDLDPQSHLTIHLGLDPENIEAGSYKVLTGQSAIGEELVMVRPNLWLLPSNVNLVGAETELVSVVGRETILREAIVPIENEFDFLIIDCAPSLGLLTLNALAATEEVLIPLQPHFLALQGFGKLLHTVELVNNRINPQLKVKGVLLCMFDSRASLPNEVKADIENFLASGRGTQAAWADARILPVAIRRNIKLAEAPSYGQTIFEYEPNCHGAEDYQKVADFFRDEKRFDGPIEQHRRIEDIVEIPVPDEPVNIQQLVEEKPQEQPQPAIMKEPPIDIQSIPSDKLRETIAEEIARQNHQEPKN